MTVAAGKGAGQADEKPGGHITRIPPRAPMRQFDLHADAYDAIRRKIVYPEALYQRLSSACRDHAAALDIGCGNGVSTVRLKPYFARVEGVDLGENLIAIARTNYPGIPFRVSPAESLSADRRFDLVTCATAFYWMDREAVLGRCADVLVAGGVFCAYRYDFPVVDGPARGLIEDELAKRWARHRDPRLVAPDDTLELMARSPRFVDAEQFVVPNTLELTPEELALFFLSTSYVTRFQDAEAGSGYAADFTRRVCDADRRAAVRVNFDIHGFQARTAGKTRA